MFWAGQPAEAFLTASRIGIAGVTPGSRIGRRTLTAVNSG
ncbi:hypothetical protein N184_05685 [Sinorhizobium sp. GL28]|nr:hypothetical protein N184_05685 [Sinorhizobium sp. GL28]